MLNKIASRFTHHTALDAVEAFVSLNDAPRLATIIMTPFAVLPGGARAIARSGSRADPAWLRETPWAGNALNGVV